MAAPMKRVRQFFRALNSQLTIEDGRYISTHLTAEEQKLFFAMDVTDQCHSLRTAYAIERFAIDDKQGVDREFLIRCALLHDVGRVKGDMSIVGKAAAVLASEVFPGAGAWLERRGSRLMYVYKHHAELGAKKLQDIGLFREAKIVAKHHSPPSPDDPKELKLLRLADEKS
ncbi:MAG: HD domain-containing protein [Selenomonadaceae bacterium]|nr:HD domain-containing protein [Selenomonadaceae bacterium]